MKLQMWSKWHTFVISFLAVPGLCRLIFVICFTASLWHWSMHDLDTHTLMQTIDTQAVYGLGLCAFGSVFLAWSCNTTLQPWRYLINDLLDFSPSFSTPNSTSFSYSLSRRRNEKCNDFFGIPFSLLHNLWLSSMKIIRCSEPSTSSSTLSCHINLMMI
jgi:hypothetical protein